MSFDATKANLIKMLTMRQFYCYIRKIMLFAVMFLNCRASEKWPFCATALLSPPFFYCTISLRRCMASWTQERKACLGNSFPLCPTLALPQFATSSRLRRRAIFFPSSIHFLPFSWKSACVQEIEVPFPTHFCPFPCPIKKYYEVFWGDCNLVGIPRAGLHSPTWYPK